MDYKITFQKDQLGFLKNYTKVNDKESGKYIILNLSIEESGKYMSFELTTNEVDVVTKLQNDTLELNGCTEKSLTFKLSDFYSFISLVNESDTIVLEDNIFKIRNGNYPIRELSEKVSRQTVVSLIDRNFTKIKLTQLEKLKTLKSYIGATASNMDAILYQNNNYTAYSDVYSCVVQGEEQESDPIYLTPRMVDVLNSMDIESVTINLQKEQNIIVIKHGETLYFFKLNKRYKVPYLLDERYKHKWHHEFKVKLQLSDFTNVLTKFRVLADDEISNLFFKFKLVNNKMKIETMNSTSGCAYEFITASYPAELENVEIPLSVDNTLLALKAFMSSPVEELTMLLKPEDPEKEIPWVSSFSVQGDDDPNMFVIIPVLAFRM